MCQLHLFSFLSRIKWIVDKAHETTSVCRTWCWCGQLKSLSNPSNYREASQKHPPEVFCEKGVLKNFAKFTGKYLSQSLFFNKVAGLKSAKQSNFIEITLWHGSSPVNLLHIFRTPFSKNTSGGLFLRSFGLSLGTLLLSLHL